MIALGPKGGAGFTGDRMIGPAAVAAIKGRDMFVTGHAALFGATPPQHASAHTAA